MNSSEKDYMRLYLLQDKFLTWWVSLGLPFYLTGGTALGRYYINHRYSEDLDFFINADIRFPGFISELKSKIISQFETDVQTWLLTDDFTRFFITEDDLSLKIELVNDVNYYAGHPTVYKFGLIDNPLNILSNKLSAIVGRDEPKDVFDIVHLSLNYSFNWRDIFTHTKQKAVVNELDVEQRLYSFPVELLKSVNWSNSPVDPASFKKILMKVADDFLLGKENSLGSDKISIESARPG
jgi:predicted nucleotidyltransferase component of viral defense system